MGNFGSCQGCPLNGCKGFSLPIDNRTRPGILFLGGFPVKGDYDRGYFRDGTSYAKHPGEFTNPKTAVIKSIVDSVQKQEERDAPVITRLQLFFSYACLCIPPYSEEKHKYEISVNEIERCSANLRAWLDRSGVAAVLAMGTDAMRALGIRGTASSRRGSIVKFKRSNGTELPVVCTYQVSELSKYPGLTPVVVKDVEKAFRLALAKKLDNSDDVHIQVLYDVDEILTTLEQAESWLQEQVARGLLVHPIVAYDTETSSLTPYRKEDRVISISLSWQNNQGLAFPWQHKDWHYSDADFARLSKALERFLSHGNYQYVVANGKFDWQWLVFHYGLKLKPPYWDTMLVEHMLEEDKQGEYSLKDITRDRLPAYGNYENYLQTELKKAWAEKEAKVSEIRQQYVASVKENLVDWWIGLSREERSAKIGDWVGRNLVNSLKSISDLIEVKYIKRKGEMVIPKKYKASVASVLNKLPLEELGLASSGPNIPLELLVHNYEDIDIGSLLTYGAYDALCTRRIVLLQNVDIKREERLNPLPEGYANMRAAMQEITMPLSLHLADMEYYGVRLDRDKAREYTQILEERIAEAKERMVRTVGYEFNPNANADLAKVLFGDMQYKSTRVTESGQPSVDAQALKELSEEHPDETFIGDLLLYRKMRKVLSTYIKDWLEQSEYDGKIHCTFKQHGTCTFRLSSSNPNLQNVPFALKMGKDEMLNLKSLFLPDDGYELFDCDISNAEMRVLAGYSKDSHLVEAFNSGKDLHCLTAAGISNFTYEDILANKDDKTTEQYRQRQVAKKVNFGTIYCMSGKTLQTRLWEDMRIRVTEEEANEYLMKFFQTYPGVKDYIDRTKLFAEQNNYTFTYQGRRRRFPIGRYERSMASRMARQAVNARIQSSSSDLVMANLIDLSTYLRTILGGRMLFTVHDSLVFQAPVGSHEGMKDVLDKLITRNTAERAPWLPVQWKYDCEWGFNYGDAHNAIC